MAVVADDAGDTTEIRTFLIADVRGYTRYTQEHGDEAAAHLAARFADIVGEMGAGRDGRVVEEAVFHRLSTTPGPDKR